MGEKFVFHFREGRKELKHLLGGKGANLAEMTRIGVRVPPGFTVSTDACRVYSENNHLPDEMYNQILDAMKELEKQRELRFGDEKRPLLVSVRSGAVISMPGMMDTILNLGLNDKTVKGLSEETDNPRFAYDCYRRFIQMFGNVVLGLESARFEKLLHQMKQKRDWKEDKDVAAEGWQELIQTYQLFIKKETGSAFPQEVYEQLKLAVEAVFRSWHNPRAKVYRKVHGISDDLGTAVNVQSMVFGNLNENSGTGVAFTRNPSTGEDGLYGEFLTDAQGEDVVAGIRTPLSIGELHDKMPAIYKELDEYASMMELHYKDMQDIEFTIEEGKLYILQTRNGKRSAQAAVKIAIDLVNDGIIGKDEAIQRIDPSHLNKLLHRQIDQLESVQVIASGLPASPGAASGMVVFNADTADAWAREGKQVLLVRAETTPEDIHGIIAASGVLTSRGGMTSHAAVVARGMGKSCVCGCDQIYINEEEQICTIGEFQIKSGDWLSIDGSTGNVILGKVNVTESEMSPDLVQLLEWADGIKRMSVLANADNPEDAKKARELGAQGIGLCRTEHMFMSDKRLPVVRAMILAENEKERTANLHKLLPMQQADFEGIFREMDGFPVSIRLLDPPLHEFLPNLDELNKQIAGLQNSDKKEDEQELKKLKTMVNRAKYLHESNPMLGHRGCRLGVIFPEIYDMQIEAIFRAALTSIRGGIKVLPEIMIPLVSDANELKLLRQLIDEVAEQVLGLERKTCPYKVGTMIEVPRAALTASEVAKYADFFSFGTNDLTQMTFGYSRDDVEAKFLNQYVDRSILKQNPFQVLDNDGVGQLIEWAVRNGKKRRSNLKTGICGEHGGDKDSIFFCEEVGLDYVSCSPFRVPLARLAAAQAVLKEQNNKEKKAV